MSTDAELLQRYIEIRDERAFAELVQRHLNVVYGAALRRTSGRTHLAEEISQNVFCDLARQAASLLHHPALIGWLHRSTRNATIDAVRRELRSQKLAQSLTAMSDNPATPEPSLDWEHLRPVIDEAMDQLKESDREVMLLRYFDGLSYAEVGTRMNLSENTARMRTDRALDKLRGHLGKRGVTSTTAALGLLLANQTFAAVPAGLAASVTSAGLAAAAAGGSAGILSIIFMSKITAPIVSAALAAGVTALVWTTFVPNVTAEEIAALRQENARLAQATAPGASSAAVAAVADEYATQVTAIAQGLAQRVAKPGADSPAGTASVSASAAGVTPRGHRDHGIATAHDAAMTFAWAGDVCDPEVLGKLIYFDPAAREKALAVLETMPGTIRSQYPTPEAFYGLLLAASCLEGPPPGADILERYAIVELSPGRVAHRPPGTTRNNHEYQQTADGWKYVLPEAGVKGLPSILNSQTLAKLAKH